MAGVVAYRRPSAVGWGVIAFGLLAAGAALVAQVSADRVAAATRADLERVLDVVPPAHFAYLGPRITAGTQLVRLIEDRGSVSPKALERLAHETTDNLPGIAAFLVYGREGRLLWTAPALPPDLDLRAPVAALDAAAHEDAAALVTAVAEIPGWGRTLFVRFPGGETSTLVEALLLDPLYETFFGQDFRDRLDFEVVDGSTLLYRKVVEPGIDTRIRASRSFSVTGHRWTMSVWPRESWGRGRLRETWWSVFGTGLGLALGASGLLGWILMRWGHMTRHIELTEARFREIVDATSETILSMTPSGAITDANPAASRTTGYGTPELVGRSLAELVSPDSETACARLLEGTASASILLTLQRRDGERRTVEATARRQADPLRGERVDVVLHDITELKQAEAAMAEARDQAVENARLRAQFLANMSHEIRTPMNGVIGLTELTLEMELPAAARQHLELVRTSADALLTVINDILDFSKIEAGKLALDPIEFGLRDSLGETVKMLALRAHDKGLELAYRVDPDVPDALVGDSARLRQVITNLIGNAIKFTEAGEVVLSVEPGRRHRDTFELQFAVTDTGIGIPIDRREAIFKAFEQADGSTTRKHGGTGLGLAICTQLVELMGGHISVEPNGEHGSIFRFTVRFGLGAPPEARFVPRALQDLAVLVVDDNATSRGILEEMLAGWKMRPAVAETGEMALTLLEQARAAGSPFQVVLLGADLKGEDSLALARVMSDVEPSAGLRILLLTSDHQSPDEERARAAGVVGCLTKPIAHSELLDAIATAIGATAPVASRAATALSAAPPATRHGHVLLAEDNVINQKLAVILLRRRGHTVVVANDGREALAAVQAEAFDAVLMDVQMPEMDGFETTAAIRRLELGTGAHLPIIAMTAHALTGDRQRCLDGGMDGYVSKPIQPAVLFEVLEGLLPEVPAAAPEIAVDIQQALECVGGDMTVLHDLVGLFVTDQGPALLSAIRGAVAAGDGQALTRAAHSLKGSAGAFGGTTICALAARLEAMGRADVLGAEAVPTCESLAAEMARFGPALLAQV